MTAGKRLQRLLNQNYKGGGKALSIRKPNGRGKKFQIKYTGCFADSPRDFSGVMVLAKSAGTR
jgi:hypothetical protein